MMAALLALSAIALSLGVPDVVPEDLTRFPPPEVVQEALDFNLAYREALFARMDLLSHRREELSREADEAYRLWWLWDCLRCAHGGSLFWQQELRRLLGEADYHQGRMPPAVPLWRFRVRD